MSSVPMDGIVESVGTPGWRQSHTHAHGWMLDKIPFQAQSIISISNYNKIYLRNGRKGKKRKRKTTCNRKEETELRRNIMNLTLNPFRSLNFLESFIANLKFNFFGYFLFFFFLLFCFFFGIRSLRCFTILSLNACDFFPPKWRGKKRKFTAFPLYSIHFARIHPTASQPKRAKHCQPDKSITFIIFAIFLFVSLLSAFLFFSKRFNQI